MKRRAFLSTGLALSAAGLMPADEADLKNYQAISQALRHAYQRTPAAMLQPRVEAELEALSEELAVADGETLNQLLVPYAELQLLAAWMDKWDMADPRAGAAHTREAARAAHQAGNADVLAHAFTLHAMTCSGLGRVDDAIQAAEQARRLTSRHRPATYSYVHVALGNIRSKTEDERRTLADLETANDALSRVGPSSMWPGTGSWGRERAVGYEAYALRRLGRAEAACATLQAAFDDDIFKGHRVKYRAVHEADQADTMAAMGEVEEAVSWAMAAYNSATSMGYVGVIEQLRDLHRDLAPYAHVGAVRELGERLRV